MRIADCGLRIVGRLPAHSTFHIPHPASRSGVALITTIIIFLLLGSMGAALIGMVQNRLLSVNLEVDRLQASYLAEAGLARAMYETTKDRDVFGGGLGTIPPTGFGPGYFQVQQDPKSRTLLGLGVVRDVRRVIVNKY